MKPIIFSLIFMISCPSILAQNLRVEIKDGREYLPYGYIFVNGKIRAVCDSSGVANLKIRELNIGDTISASYIGYKPKWKIFNSKMAKIQLCELLLDINIHNIETVTIMGVYDAEKLFSQKS